VRISGFTVQTKGTLNHELKNKGMMETVRCVCYEKIKLAMLRKSKHNVISSRDINFQCAGMGKVLEIKLTDCAMLAPVRSKNLLTTKD